MKIPDFSTPLTGWRSWEAHNGFLKSWGGVSIDGQFGNTVFWPPRKALEARCHDNNMKCCPHCNKLLHEAPVSKCMCGIYSFKTFDKMMAESYAVIQRRLRTAAFGQIFIWGRVFEHQWGWRAQYGYPRAVFSDDKALATNYGIEVRPIDDLRNVVLDRFSCSLEDLQYHLRGIRRH